MVTVPVTATTFLDGYLQYLKQDGWDVTLVCSSGSGVSEFTSAAGVSFEPLEMMREPAPLHDLRSLFKAYRLLRRLRPEVLVYATPKASLVGSIAGRFARVPGRVYELWGLRMETAHGTSRRVFGWLEWLTARLSTTVIANSYSLADRARALRVNAGREVLVLGRGSSHGVDSHRFSRNAPIPVLDGTISSAIARSGAPVVGFIGRLHPDKGIDTLIDALGVIAREGVKFQLLIVGNDEGAQIDEQLLKLRALVPVHVIGYASDVRVALRVMDALVLPSRREGFPNVVLEAAAMEVPAIVSDATGCRDSVVDGLTGRIAHTGDVSSFASEIGAMLQNKRAREDMGRAARQYVIEQFAPQDVWSRHSEAWRRSHPQTSTTAL